MQPSRDVARLVEIMSALRDPTSGCPWDLEQSFDSIVPYTTEELYEVIDAIERRDPDDLREELGDLLLQVIYYCQLASEEGLFSFGDVVETITRKMIRRHPHVFGDAEARNARSAKGQWDRIKAEEKAERAELRERRQAEPVDGASGEWRQGDNGTADLWLDHVPGTFPALMTALKVQQRAAKVGFDWDRPEPILDKLREETSEFEAAVADGDPAAIEDELGDLMFCLVNLARHYEIDPDRALKRTVRKFRDRFAHIELELRRSGASLEDASLEEMERLWVAAKTTVRTSSDVVRNPASET